MQTDTSVVQFLESLNMRVVQEHAQGCITWDIIAHPKCGTPVVNTMVEAARDKLMCAEGPVSLKVPVPLDQWWCCYVHLRRVYTETQESSGVIYASLEAPMPTCQLSEAFAEVCQERNILLGGTLQAVYTRHMADTQSDANAGLEAVVQSMTADPQKKSVVFPEQSGKFETANGHTVNVFGLYCAGWYYFDIRQCLSAVDAAIYRRVS